MRLSSVLFLLAVGLLASLLATPANAGGCRSVVSYTPYVAPVTYVDRVQVIEKSYVNIARFVDVPLYSTFFNALYAPGVAPYGYGAGIAYAGVQPGYAPQASTCEQKLSLLEQRLLKLEGGPLPGAGQPKTAPGPMQKADNGNGAEAPATPGDPAARLVAQFTTNGCVQCHADAKKDGGLTLVTGGKLAQLSPEAIGKILFRVTTKGPKRMPPPESGRTLTPEAIVSFTNTIVGE